MLDAALEYAGRGWAVFPIHNPTSFGPKSGPDKAYCSCRNSDCENQGKHPRTRDGFKSATTDRDQIRDWWTNWPNANIGAPTGITFDVIDFDGLEAVDQFNERFTGYPIVDNGPQARTGQGIHVFTQPAEKIDGRTTSTSNVAGIAKLDYRGVGGYVVVPPSQHYSGVRYRWCDGHGLDAPLDPAATWLLDAPRATAEADAPEARPTFTSAPRAASGGRDGGSWRAVLDGLCRKVEHAETGTRNNMFSWAVWKILDEHAPNGMPETGLALAALERAGRSAGLTDKEMRACLNHALRKKGQVAA